MPAGPTYYSPAVNQKGQSQAPRRQTCHLLEHRVTSGQWAILHASQACAGKDSMTRFLEAEPSQCLHASGPSHQGPWPWLCQWLCPCPSLSTIPQPYTDPENFCRAAVWRRWKTTKVTGPVRRDGSADKGACSQALTLIPGTQW